MIRWLGAALAVAVLAVLVPVAASLIRKDPY